MIPSGHNATVDLGTLERALTERSAAVMLTVPNTLGLFEPQILEVTRHYRKLRRGALWGNRFRLRVRE